MESLRNSLFLFLSLLLFVSSTLVTNASTQAGTIERTTKQQVIASIPPSGPSQLFITSPSGKYEGYLLRHETAPGAGGFGNDFCYIQIQASGHSVWESECAPVSTVNTCSLVFSDAGLEIFDGSRSTWDTDADADDPLETLELVDSGDMQIRDRSGNLAWKASDNPIVNQQCGSVGSPGLASALPPFASPIPTGGLNFGQPSGGNSLQPQTIGYQQQPLSGLTSPFGENNQPLVDNTPFDSGAASLKKTLALAFALGTLLAGLLY